MEHIQEKLYDLFYVVKVYLCILLDNFKLLQYNFNYDTFGKESYETTIKVNDIYKNYEHLLYKNHGINLNYGSCLHSGIKLNITKSVKKVCIVPGALNPGFITNLARNFPETKFDIYSSNDNLKNYLELRNYENLTNYNCDELFYDSNKNNYDRILIGPIVVNTNYHSFIYNLRANLTDEGKLILQTVFRFSNKNETKNKQLIRNSLTFNNFFVNTTEKRDDYIIPTFEKVKQNFGTILNIIPTNVFVSDAELLMTNFKKYSKEYDFLFKLSRTLKLFGHKYYLGTFEIQANRM
jgi:hypothetical protein